MSQNVVFEFEKGLVDATIISTMFLLPLFALFDVDGYLIFLSIPHKFAFSLSKIKLKSINKQTALTRLGSQTKTIFRECFPEP